MAFGKHKKAKEQDAEELLDRPAFDDFNYDDTFESVTAGLPGTEPETAASADAVPEQMPEENMSDTPEVALTKLERERRARMAQFREEESAQQKKKRRKEKTHRERSRRSDLQEDKERERERAQDRAATALPQGLRLILILIVSIPFLFVIGCMTVSQFFDLEILNVPGSIVATVLSPVQGAVSWVADTFSDYLYDMKLRANIETEYSKVVAENEELTYKAMLADELQIQLSRFETIYDEVSVNTSMNPLVCTVIGRSDGNYFSSFTINRGSRDGIEQYMAVTSDGALIGYTETVNATSSTVRTIIDSEASIAGLIQSSRDQGTIRGTLGTDGKALCRMYYLPDDSLPRPGDLVVTSGVGMSFPKGIPIGTVRESTRGMESNKSYVVVNPTADFEHIEYVVVLRYQPAVQSIQASSNVSAYIGFVPADTARPYPTLRIGSASFYSSTPTPVPEDYVSPSPAPTEVVTPEPTATPVPTPENTEKVIEYQVVATGPTPTPVPTPVPTATPYVTIDPASLTLEEE